MSLRSQYPEKIKRRIMLIWAISVLWVYVGNIINFHQHHIWGKQLIPVACTSNRSKGKSLDQQGSTLTHLTQPGFISQDAIQADSKLNLSLSESSSVFYFHDEADNLSIGCLMSLTLRGPPLA